MLKHFCILSLTSKPLDPLQLSRLRRFLRYTLPPPPTSKQQQPHQRHAVMLSSVAMTSLLLWRQRCGQNSLLLCAYYMSIDSCATYLCTSVTVKIEVIDSWNLNLIRYRILQWCGYYSRIVILIFVDPVLASNPYNFILLHCTSILNVWLKGKAT